MSKEEKEIQVLPDLKESIPLEKLGQAISPDGGLYKKIIKEGNGERPPQRSKLVCHYIATLQSGEEFDNSRKRDMPFKFDLGKKKVIQGWDVGIFTMTKGEVAVLTIRHDYGYGDSSDIPNIPAKSVLIFEVELLGWEDPDPDTIEERLKFGENRKLEGNKLFGAQQFKEAVEKYQFGLSYFDHAYGASEDEKKKIEAIKLVLYLNLAMSQIKIQEYGDAILSCHKALDIETKNVKALFRRGQAYMLDAQFEKAKNDFKEALQYDPKNKQIRDEMVKLKKLEQDFKQKQKNMYATMMSKMSYN